MLLWPASSLTRRCYYCLPISTTPACRSTFRSSDQCASQMARTPGPTLQEIIPMKAIVVTDQAAGTAGYALIFRSHCCLTLRSTSEARSSTSLMRRPESLHFNASTQHIVQRTHTSHSTFEVLSSKYEALRRRTKSEVLRDEYLELRTKHGETDKERELRARISECATRRCAVQLAVVTSRCRREIPHRICAGLRPSAVDPYAAFGGRTSGHSLPSPEDIFDFEN